MRLFIYYDNFKKPTKIFFLMIGLIKSALFVYLKIVQHKIRYIGGIHALGILCQTAKGG